MNGATDTTLELRRSFSEVAALQPEPPGALEIPDLKRSFGAAVNGVSNISPPPSPAQERQINSPDMGTIHLVEQSLTQNYQGLKAPQSMASELGGQTMKIGGEFFGRLFGQKPDSIVLPPQMQMNRPFSAPGARPF